MPNTTNDPSVEDWKRALDALPDLICTLDSEHKVRWMNHAMAKKLGVTQAEATGLTCYEAVHGTTCPPDYCPHRQMLQDQQEHAVEIQEERLGGDFLVTCTPLRNQGGQLVGSLHVARDITERKRTEEALRLFKESVENSSDAVGMSTPEGKHYYQNKVFDEWFGEIGEKPPETLYVDHDVGHEVFRAIMAGGKWTGEVQMYARDRSILTILLRAYASKDKTGRITALVGAHTDITVRKQAEAELQKSKLITDNIPVGLYLYHLEELSDDRTLRMVYANPAVKALTGLGPEEVVGKTLDENFPGLRAQGIPQRYAEVVRNQTATTFEDLTYGDDRVLSASFLAKAFPLPSNMVGIAFENITERKQAEDERESLRKTAEALAEVFLGLGREPQQNMDRIVRAACEVTGGAAALYNRLNDTGCSIEIWSSHQLPPDMPRADTPQGHICYEATIHGRDRTTIIGNLENTDYERTDPAVLKYGLKAYLGHPIQLGGVAVGALAVVDIKPRNFTPGEIGAIQMLAKALSLEEERRLAEQEFKQSEERFRGQLFQAQKMESVGRLAGGVAHDFNNMLGVILGYAQLAMLKIGQDDPLHADLDEIRKAGERSADLTRQLLAFARKQTVAPQVLDLNETVEGMHNMLRRLIGEDIDLAWRPGSNLGPIFIDPSQVDQILANLCVNARDAIADTGKITIETDSACFDEAYCTDHAYFVPGEFVMLAVSDDGCGMDPETLGVVFEPFFTTKELGKGTGLGLATIYGIVKQNNGFINVYSEPGHGTTFKIYLPQHTAKAAPRSEQEQAPAPAAGGETILLVEDEQAILEVATRMLEQMGYGVIAAATPGEAIRLAREHQGRINLLMTDVVMPEMNGRDLAGNLISIYPGMRRLFMSGYTANVIAHHGVLDQGVHFLQKPFSMQDLAAKIREALDRE